MAGSVNALIAVFLAGTGVFALQGRGGEVRDNKVLDEILEVHVRDGWVSYRALKTERNRVDGYVGSLANASLDSASREQQISFWLNAYNALVLQTVVDNYPIAQRTKEYPPRSIRQIPGAFERLQHRIAGRSVTLDQIEQTFLAAFHDPRVFLALGRGAAGSGRLRSEAYTSSALERQLSEVASECVNHAQCFQLDQIQNRLVISSIFSWRRNEFIDAFAGAAPQEDRKSVV